jgi:eukaryotic-like serine/threonine-protein kinase
VIATGTRLKERYRLERLLGRGGMASVWLATDGVLDRPVAIKVLSDTIASDPEFLARFRREARIAAGLSHPNLIGVYDYAEGEERPYLVMEHVAGENLAERLAGGGGVDPERLARELLGALDHIHRAGILHRDVKPQNVLLAPDGSAKLIDFGIALPRDATALTRTGNLLGTARYVAPEVMSGQAATERADLYSCGVVLRDCLGSRSPRGLSALVERLASPEPGRRPRSAAAALSEVERVPVAGEPTERMATVVEPATAVAEPRRSEPDRTQPPPPAPALSRQGSSRPRWAAAAALLLALVGIGGLVALMVTGSDEQPGGGPASGEVAEAPAREARQDEGAPQPPESARPADESGEAASAPPPPEPAGADPSSGSALNEEGFALIEAGEPEAAVPVLEEAVRAFPPGTEDVNYAYALFNLGNALRLSGRPEEAIPVLERRLEIPNQTEVVEEELEAARAEAGG